MSEEGNDGGQPQSKRSPTREPTKDDTEKDDDGVVKYSTAPDEGPQCTQHASTSPPPMEVREGVVSSAVDVAACDKSFVVNTSPVNSRKVSLKKKNAGVEG